MWRQCLQAAPRWQLERIKALIYPGNMQAKCYVIPLAYLDVRAVSLPSNQYGTVPGLISSISLIRPGRMLRWCGHAALGPRRVSLQGTALRHMGLPACWGLKSPPPPRCAGRGRCPGGVCSVFSPCWTPGVGQWLRSLCTLFVLESSPGETNNPVAIGGPCSVESTFQGFALLISK